MDPLFDAILTGNFDLLKILIKSGRKTDIRNDSGWTLLHAAVSVNRIDIVTYLIEQDDLPVNIPCFEGKTSLLLACEIEEINPKIIECLLNAKADVNIANNDGMTPLHAACRNANLEITEILLNSDANVNCQEFNGYTPLHYIALSNSIESLHLLLNFHQTDRIFDINAVDFDGCTALMLAVDVANSEIATELIEYGAEVNVVGRNTTALHLSVVTQQPELFEALWLRFDFNVLVELTDCNNIIKLMVKYGWFFPDRIDVMFHVLNHPNAILLLSQNIKILTTFFYRMRFVKNILDINISDILRKFLKIGVGVNESDLRAFIQNFYRYQYRYDLLDILIQEGLANFDSVDLLFFSVDSYPNLVPTLLSYCIRVNPLDIFTHFSETLFIKKETFKLLILILYLCTPDNVLRKRCRIHLMTFSFAENILENGFDQEMIEMYKVVNNILKVCEVPSLKELARNEYRKYLSQFCTNSYDYVNILNNLILPKDIVDLIQCKMAVKLF